MRSLLYHRDIDDHVSGYVTDYVCAIVTFPLCIWLIIKIIREKKNDEYEPPWPPWKSSRYLTPPITLMTYLVLTYTLSMTIMALLGGVVHQTLQEVDNYNYWTDDPMYLIIWKVGAAFLCPALFCLLSMADIVLMQEGQIRIPKIIRKVYYVIALIVSFLMFVYNFLHIAITRKPFSLRYHFILFLSVVFIYIVASTFVLLRRICANSALKARENQSSNEDYNQNGTHNQSLTLKLVAGRCHNITSQPNDVINNGITASLVLHVISPWIFLIGAATNFLLRSKCAKSHDAFGEQGCPLPNEFNHNSLFHVIYGTALVLLVIAELVAIKERRRRINKANEVPRNETNENLLNNTDDIV